MSETKTNEPVKQEGEFKLKKKTPKKLGITNNDPVKVDLTKPEATGEVVPNVVKVDIPKDDAIQIGETKKLDVGEQTGDSAKVDAYLTRGIVFGVPSSINRQKLFAVLYALINRKQAHA